MLRSFRETGAPAGRLWAAVFTGYVSFGIGFQVLPATADERFPSSAWAVGAAVTVGSLAAAAARPLAGRRADRVNARAVTFLGATLATVGATAQLLAPELELMVFGRLLVGAGEGALFTGAIAWVLHEASERGRGQLVGHFGLSLWLGYAAGPPLGAGLVSVWGVAAAWGAALALCGLSLAVVMRTPREVRLARPGPTAPLIARGVGRPALALGLMAFGYGTIAGFLVLRMTGEQIAGAGVALGIFGIAFVTVRFAGSALVDRYRPPVLMALLALVQALGLGLVALGDRPATVLAGVALAGAGASLVYPLVVTAALHLVPARRRGSAVGTLTSSWDLGLAAAGPLGGALAGPLGLSAPFILAAAAVSFAALPLALRTHNPKRAIAVAR